ncbi:MAG: PD40 domain-containing protein [Armatimonadetes bacterium]|nr:PD40 domain-containing protein [Armatimonadota bacterium]
MTAYGKGTQHPSESRRFEDGRTGARIVQVTAHPSVSHNLYFLTSSFTPDSKHVLFASSRSGKFDFFRAAFPDGPILQLTDREGIHGLSGVLSRDGTVFYYTAGGEAWALDMNTLEERRVARYPGGQMGECSLSCDGQHIVTALKWEGQSCIAVSRADGSGSEIIFRCPRTIIHPQFHPSDSALIEYAQDPAPRMWLIRIDGSDNTCLYRHGNDEFIVHETFLGSGSDIIFTRWPYALRKLNLATGEISDIAPLNAWHISGSRDGATVLCDTVHPDIGVLLVDVRTGEHRTVCYPQSSSQGSQWRKDRYALAGDWAAAASEREKSLSWMEMKTDTIYGPQWTHPHPAFSPDHRRIVYTSDASGYPQVYAAEIAVEG